MTLLDQAQHFVERLVPGASGRRQGDELDYQGALVVTAHAARLRLRVIEPERVPDPHGMLDGKGAMFVTRADDLNTPAVRALIVAALGGGKRPKRPGRPAARPAQPASVHAGVDSARVSAATGKGWDQWLAELDAAGARERNHQEIVALLAERGVAPWWQQMITVGYEQARGLREQHETPDGFQVGVGKTLAVPVADLYRAWDDPVARKRWLGGVALTVRKATIDKSMRITWPDGSHVSVMFLRKGAHKSMVQVDQRKLPSRAEVERARTFWQTRLAKLQMLLEG
jgi:hypothetical protein